jgi:cellulose synthase operon protein C
MGTKVMPKKNWSASSLAAFFRQGRPVTNRTASLCGLPSFNQKNEFRKNEFKDGARFVSLLIITVAALFLPFAGVAHAQSSRVEQAVVEKARSLESRGLMDLAAQTWQQVLLSQPDNTEALAGLARAAKRRGMDAEAARYVQRLRQINPKDPQIAAIESMVSSKVQDARLAQAEALAAAHDYAGAMQAYRQLYGEHPPDDVALAYYETEAATETGRSQAIAGLRALAKLHPGERRYQATLGRVLTYNPKTRAEGEALLQQLPQEAGAQTALRQALLWDAQNPASAGAIHHYLNLHPDAELAQHMQETETRQMQQPKSPAVNPAEQAAYAALQGNNVDGAESGFTALLEKEPNNPRALAGIGFVHMKQGKFDQAVTDFEAALHHGSKDGAVKSALDTARFWHTMAEAGKALEQNQLDLAAQRYRDATAQRPASPEALAGLAGTLLRGQQDTEAEQIYARWVKLQPNSAPAWRGLFVTQAQAGQPQLALSTSKRFPTAVQETLQADPEYLLNLAAAYRTTGDEAKASQTLEQALKLPFPEGGRNMKAELRMQYAAVLAAAGREQQAAELYGQVVAEQPGNYAAWQGLILSQHMAHDDAGAVASVERMPPEAAAAGHRDSGFLSLVAAAYQQQGRNEEAQRLLEEAEAVLAQQGSKPSADLELQMAAIERQRNHPQAAVAIYRRVIATDPERVTAWNDLLSTLHQSGDDAQALAEVVRIPAQIQSELSRNDDYLLTLSAIYSAGGHSRWALATLVRLRALYTAQHTTPPAEVEIQTSWLLFSAGDERDLYSTLMRLGARDDLTDGQRSQIQNIWAAWSVRRATQAANAGNTRRSLLILNTARDALGGNAEVSRALAGGYLAAGDAPSALGIYQSLDLTSAADYQGAIGAALAANNLKLAENWLRQALELYPRDARVLGLAARFEQARGDNGRARDFWKASLAASPNTGAAARLAQTLRTPVAGSRERGPLQPADQLASLLGAQSGEARPINVLPGGSETESGMVADPAPEPYLEAVPKAASGSSPSPAGGRGERLSDYRPLAEESQSSFDALPTGGEPSFQAASAPPPISPDYPPTAVPKRRRLLKDRNIDVPVLQAAPDDAPRPEVSRAAADDRLQAAADALASAGGGQSGATPPLQLVTHGLDADADSSKVISSKPGAGGKLTIHYASAGQANPSPALGGAPRLQETQQQQVPQTPGLTDQQLLDSQLPPLRGNYVPARPTLNAHQEALQQIEAIDGGLSPWVGGTGDVHHRSGTAGYDQLTALEAPFETSTLLGTDARLTVITTPVFLDAGVADGTSTLSLGTLPVGTIPPQQYADGVASELQLTAVNFAARVGQTPYGFLVKNITGGVRWRPAGGPITFVFSRDGSKETQLAYSGLRDPGSATATFDGNIWGGIVVNAGNVQVAHGSALSGFYAGVGGQYITGQHVLTNTRFHGNAGAYWRVLTLPSLGTLVLGADFFGMHYAHNLRYFTYGQGGYFSPEAYFLAGMPLSWAGHYGPNLHYNVRGSIGVQSFQEDSEPYYPLDPGLQAAAGNPLEPVHASVGANYDLQTEIAYRVQDHWYVGGFLDFNNTRDYVSQSGGFFVRYLFRPQPESEGGPIGVFPRDGFRPVMVP